MRFFAVSSVTRSVIADKDQNAVALQIDEMPLRRTVQALPGIRLLEGATLPGLAVKANTISPLLDGANEYCFAADVADAVSRANLSGVEWRHFRKPKSHEVHPAGIQLFSERILGATEENPGTSWADERGGYRWFRCVDCLTYRPDALEGAADFNRTAEPWTGTGIPGWIVKRRVPSILKERKTRGWTFLPVFEVGTELCDEYLRIWRELRKKLAKQPKQGRNALL